MLAPTIGTKQRRNERIIVPFAPLPWQITPWRDRSPIVLLTGSAGGGKSRLAGEKAHAFCLKYPGATAIVARKIKLSMSAGIMLFFRRKIVGPDRSVRWIDSPKSRFEYRNGSILQFVGLADDDARENLKSIGQDGAVDFAEMEEGTQFEEEDLNAMIARMRGKAAPWRQIIISTNPDAPTHWIKRRLIDGGGASVYYSSAADNFHNPADYQVWLATLTGIEYQRLVLGQWVQATGLVYDVWSDGSPDGNVTEAADYEPGAGAVYWAVDDGYSGERDAATGMFTEKSSPRVFLLVQERANGRLCVFHESYEIKTLENHHIARVLLLPHDMSDLGKPAEDQSWIHWALRKREDLAKAERPCYPLPACAAVDSAAAELRAQLHAAQIYTQGKPPTIEESIKPTRRMLAPDANGWRRILVHPRCRHLRAEMASYRRDPVTGKPIDAFNHGPDSLRQLAWTKRQEA